MAGGKPWQWLAVSGLNDAVFERFYSVWVSWQRLCFELF